MPSAGALSDGPWPDPLRTELVLDGLDIASEQRDPEETIHHSGQGPQYTAVAFGQRCEDAGVRPSMGSVGDCYDNALGESFFAPLKGELLERASFAPRPEARLRVFDFVEEWYNPHRLHSVLDYQSPMSYKKRVPPEKRATPKNRNHSPRHESRAVVHKSGSTPAMLSSSPCNGPCSRPVCYANARRRDCFSH